MQSFGKTRARYAAPVFVEPVAGPLVDRFIDLPLEYLIGVWPEVPSFPPFRQAIFSALFENLDFSPVISGVRGPFEACVGVC